MMLSLLVVALEARAQSGSELANIGSFGTMGQLNASVTSFSNTACGPTAVTDGLIFLNNMAGNQFQTYNISSSTANGYKAVNDLETPMGTSASGTSYGTKANNLVGGLANYISGGGANPAANVSIVGGQYILGSGAGIPGGPTGPNNNFAQVIPTATTLANWLNANYAINLLVQFGSYSGATWTQDPSGAQHYVDLTSINVGNNAITLLDPWGTSAVQESATLSTVGGYLYLNSLTAITPDNGSAGPDTGDSGEAGALTSARIMADLAETVVPEPSTLGLMGLGGILCILFRRRRTAYRAY